MKIMALASISIAPCPWLRTPALGHIHRAGFLAAVAAGVEGASSASASGENPAKSGHKPCGKCPLGQ